MFARMSGQHLTEYCTYGHWPAFTQRNGDEQRQRIAKINIDLFENGDDFQELRGMGAHYF